MHTIIYKLKKRPEIKNIPFVHPEKGSAWVRDAFLVEAGKQRNKEDNVNLEILYEYLCRPLSYTLDMLCLFGVI